MWGPLSRRSHPGGVEKLRCSPAPGRLG